ncbi:MAG: alpha/beta fold hydrolase [Candidatus Dormibacteraeota bacterium]|nr:alpha/beta fold hydrolase [Candidatus Dormibacteraeota bacterium]MBV9525400.1 alpha/beta fold hydrolase [Candidatus Dormibacteraeota bacterium]
MSERTTARHPLLTLASRAIDMAVLARLTSVEVLKPPVIDLTPADPAAFWRESRVSSPAPVRIADEWTPLEGRAWRAMELEGDSDGPGTHAGSRRLLATAHVRRDASPAPVVILVHGFAIPFTGFDRWLAWRMRRRGVSTVRIELPYHLRRTVPGHESGGGYFSIDPAHTRAVVRQSVEDTAALVAWARAQVSPHVTVVGTSLGGLVTTLLAAVTDLDRVLAIAPLCDPPSSFTQRPPGALQRRMGMLGEGESFWGRDRTIARQALEGALAPLVPRLLDPVTRGDRITLVRPDNDLIVGAAPIDELAAAWGTALWIYPHGHITVMNAPGMSERVVAYAVDVDAHDGDLRMAG